MSNNDQKQQGNNTQQRRFYFSRRKKVCKFCEEKIDEIDYKDVKLLKQFVRDRGRIMPRRLSGTCTVHQKKLKRAIKRARMLALLPFVSDEIDKL